MSAQAKADATVYVAAPGGAVLRSLQMKDALVSLEIENGAWKIEDDHGSLVYLPKAKRFTGKQKKRLEVLHNL